MKVSKEKFKQDLKKRFAQNELISTWENQPQIDKDGDEIINVGLAKGHLTLQQAQDLPTEIDGVKIVYHYEGEVRLMKTTDYYDPLIGGISFGSIDITAGTLGGIVWDKENNDPFLITNEHVVSDTKNNDPSHPPIGHPIVQPGPLDGGMSIAGKLVKVGGMKESAMDNKACNIDAALVRPIRGFASEEFWGIGDVKNYAHASVKPGDPIIKSGRTTGVTTNTVLAVNVSANIGGISWNSPVAMEGLIQSRTSFVEGGDSGSRVWRKDTMEPIGLVFAGSWLTSFIIPAQTICDVLGVYFGSKYANNPDNPDENIEKKGLFSRIWGFIKRIIKRIFGGVI